MKITIDTKEDSHHEIRRVIHLLNVLVGNSSVYESQVSSSSSEEYPNLNDVFSGSSSASEDSGLPNVGAFMDSVEEKKDDDKPEESSEIVMY